jgi:hypothetical protein
VKRESDDGGLLLKHGIVPIIIGGLPIMILDLGFTWPIQPSFAHLPGRLLKFETRMFGRLRS